MLKFVERHPSADLLLTSLNLSYRWIILCAGTLCNLQYGLLSEAESTLSWVSVGWVSVSGFSTHPSKELIISGPQVACWVSHLVR